MDYPILHEVLILLAASALAVALFKRLGLPSTLAYLAVGVMAGPHGLGWVTDSEETRFLAEFGVVFLLFTLGLEFSLARFIAMRREVLGLGGAQVAVTTLVFALAAWLAGMTPAQAFIAGGAVAMSSTAVVIKQLSEQLELAAPHGRNAVGVLLFQDLAVLPFLIVVPVFTGDGGISASWRLGSALALGTLVIAGMLAASRWLLRPLFRHVAAHRSSELFSLTALLFALTAAWATDAAGLSFAIGGFLAGMLLGETEFRHQVEADIRPFRDVLLGLFFITVGMLLNLHALPENFLSVVALTLSLLLFKTLSVAVIARLGGSGWPVALRTGLVLSQGGEFGLALLSVAVTSGLLHGRAVQIGVAALVFSMVLAPAVIRHNGALAKRLLADSYRRQRDWLVGEVARSAEGLEAHVIIAGFGRIGQSIARFVEDEAVEYLALDLDPVRVANARAAGDRVIYGDATRREILEAAGLHEARVLVIAFDDLHAALRIIGQVRAMSLDLPILVRTRDDGELERLQQAGATEVVPETLEASLMLASHLLLLLQVPMSRIVRRLQRVRGDRYRMLRGFFQGQEIEPLESATPFRERLHTVTLPSGAYAVDRTLDELGLKEIGVMVTAVRRGGIRGPQPEPMMRLRSGDTLVLYGTPEELQRAEAILLAG